MPYNVISTTYIAKFKINSNTEIEVFYKDKNLVSVSEVYKVQYNSNGIIRQLIGNDIKLKYKNNSIVCSFSVHNILINTHTQINIYIQLNLLIGIMDANFHKTKNFVVLLFILLFYIK